MKKIFTTVAIVILSFFYWNKSVAQSTINTVCGPFPNPIALPRMFVPDSTTDSCIKNFKKGWFLNRSKYKRLLTKNGIQDSSFTYPYAALTQLLKDFEQDLPTYKGARMYFARFNKKKAPKSFPKTIKNKELILLYAAVDTDATFKGPSVYHFLNNNDATVYPVDSATAQDWIHNYVHKNMPKLARTVDKKDSTNLDSATKRISDTRSIFYCRDNLEKAIITEYCYQLKNHSNTIDSLKFSFASYLKEGKEFIDVDHPGKVYHIYKKRLFVIFQYIITDSTGKIGGLNLQTQGDFDRRKKLLTHEPVDKLCSVFKLNGFSNPKVVQGSGGDNGQLCPTNCKP